MKHIEKPLELVSEEQIKKRVKELGKQITKDFKNKEFTIVCIMKGCIPFVADLIRNIPIPFKIDIIHAASYVKTESSGIVKIYTDISRLDIKDRYVLIIDDILDTGRTLKKVAETIKELGAVEVKTCVLLNKPSRRLEKISADYVGFEIPNAFVVGYGLDYEEYYRNLPYIGTLETVE